MQEKLRWILELTRKLAAPVELEVLLLQVVESAKELLDAEGATVWLYDSDADELVMQVSTGLDPIRIPADQGIVGASLRTRAPINVPDCYEDPRFNREIDKLSGHRTRSMLTLPLIGNDDMLVGALQIVNRRRGVFDTEDEELAGALAAQCAVALHRAQITQKLLLGEQLRQEISVAREIQLGTLPKAPPQIPGYDIVGTFRPAEATGGDTFDFVPSDGALMILAADATGHGIGPALSASQVRAMLRVAQRLGAGLDETFRHINNQLALDLPEDRFVTAFLGRLDPVVHDMRYHSGGQGPLLHFHGADGTCEMLGPTSAPLGTMAQVGSRPARFIEMMPGDIFVVCSDGVFDHENPRRQRFGAERVIELLRNHGKRPMAEMLGRLLASLEEFGEGVPQEDDVTIVLIRRLPESAGQSMRNIRFAPIPKELPAFQESFPRELEALSRIFDFVARFVVAERLGAAERYALGFTIEELFTNFLKYTPNGTGDIVVSLERRGHDVVGIMINPDTEDFDVTATPDVDIKLPAEQRKTGGLGLHLIRRVMDTVDYEYTQRTSRITFRKRIETRV